MNHISSTCFMYFCNTQILSLSTMRYIFRLLISILLLAPTMNLSARSERNYLHGNTTLQEIKGMLVTGQEWVQYPCYSDRTAWDKLTGEWKDSFIKEGEKKLDYEWKVVKATDYLAFDRIGNRNIMEEPYRSNNTALVSLVKAELAEGKGRFIDQIINGVFYYCEMTTWALAAHMSLQPGGRALPLSTFDVIDLSAGDLGNLLAWTYYFLHEEFDKVSPEISRRLYAELDKRIMTSYLTNDSFWWMAKKKGAFVNNWNPWCNSNSLMVFMLLENNKDRLAQAVYKSIVSVDQFLNYVKSDGACEEGPSYWGHAHGKAYDYLTLLDYITGGKLSIYNNPQIKSMGEYIMRSYVGDGWVVNFADASAKGGGDPYLIYRYGKSVNSKPMQQFASYLYNRNRQVSLGGRDMYRTLEALKIYSELKETDSNYEILKFSWYPETEFCYLRNEKAFLASKGGYNDESHNHNDAGTFSLWVNNTPIIIDAGVGTYTKNTFNSKRYDIWTMQSNYHNLPMINGIAQKYGKHYKATQTKATKNGFSTNIAKAYPEEACVNEWIRSYQLRNNELTIKDQFELSETKKENQINFLTWGDINITDKAVEIIVNGTKAILQYDHNTFEVKKDTINLDDKRLSNVWGNRIYRISFTAKEKVLKNHYIFKIKF